MHVGPLLTGASGGGHISIYITVNHANLFGICIGQSSVFGKHEKIIDKLRDGARLPVRLYCDAGVFETSAARASDDEFPDHLAGNRYLRDMLRERGYDVMYREWMSDHSWLSWDRGMVVALKTFWPAKK